MGVFQQRVTITITVRKELGYSTQNFLEPPISTHSVWRNTTKFCTAIKLDDGKISRQISVTQMMMRDLFAVANLPVWKYFRETWTNFIEIWRATSRENKLLRLQLLRVLSISQKCNYITLWNTHGSFISEVNNGRRMSEMSPTHCYPC